MKGAVDCFNLVSRILAAGLFFASGIGKMTAYGTDLDLMAQNSMSALFLPLVILLAVGAVSPLYSVS